MDTLRAQIKMTPRQHLTGQPSTEPSTESSLTRLKVALGTLVAVEAAHHCESAAAAAVEAAFAAVAAVDTLLHPQNQTSDLAKVNAAPLHTRVAVHRFTWELLSLAKRLNAFTCGVFDPCLPSQAGRLRDIELGSEPYVICRQPVALDFGGFAKGFAVDRGVEALIAQGCTRGLVNAGGDLRLFGPRTASVLLRGPDGHYDSLELADAALAVSDLDAQQRPAEHQGYYVRDGDRAGALRFAAVIARNATLADALGKCVLLCSGAVAARTLLSFDARCVSPGIQE
jgi:thiamine biosynthesis lipoprotein